MTVESTVRKHALVKHVMWWCHLTL